MEAVYSSDTLVNFLYLPFAGCLLGLLFYPEEGDNIFF
jgi:hypothetical protein